jgi:hypothetical protein
MWSWVSTRADLFDRCTLKPSQKNRVRVFKLGQDLISTLEQDERNDPTEVSFVESDRHHGNLWPVEVNVPRHRDPIPVAAVVPGQTRHGYPLCWSRPGFEWYPYLPAVCSLHYPVFRGMRSAAIVRSESGWKLRDEDILHWSSVEFVMLKTINIIGRGQLSGLEHVEPDWPSTFGYKRLHSSEKFARTSKTASLHAFQRMLAYCSYCVSYAYSKGDCRNQDPDSYFNNPVMADDLLRKFGDSVAGSNVHILVKFLWATLGEVYRSRNFVGIVISYHREFFYPAMRMMATYDVPVYVRWHESLKLLSYQSYDQNHMLKEWAPRPDDFKILEAPPPTTDSHLPSTSDDRPTGGPSHYLPPILHPGPARPKNTFANPMDYINKRKAAIKTIFDRFEATEQMKSRQRSAAKFSGLGHRGAFVHVFERFDSVDPQTGNKSVVWGRQKLTRHEGRLTYQAASNSQLWYEPVLFFLLFIP